MKETLRADGSEALMMILLITLYLDFFAGEDTAELTHEVETSLFVLPGRVPFLSYINES